MYTEKHDSLVPAAQYPTVRRRELARKGQRPAVGGLNSSKAVMKQKSLVVGPSLLPVFLICAVNTLAYADPADWWFGAGWHDASGRRHGGPRFGNFDKRIAGAYLVRDGNEEEGALRLISLTADGNWSGTQSQQQVPALSFSDQHGVWKRSGRREITATVLDFDVDPSTGQLVEVVRVRYVVTFSRNLQAVTGEYVGEAFSVDQDPLDPDEIPGRRFENTFTGRRVTVEME